jgi:hypothetical protein
VRPVWHYPNLSTVVRHVASTQPVDHFSFAIG